MTNPLQELISEIELTQQQMDHISDTIKKVEHTIRNLKLNFDFGIVIDCSGAEIRWEYENGKYRLLYFSDDTGTITLSGSPFHVRYKCYPHMNKFIQEFTKFIRAKRKEIQSNGQLIDMELESLSKGNDVL